MSLKEFIEKVKIESSLDIDVEKCVKFIRDEARKQATDGCAAVDDETVREWILKFAEQPVEKKEVKHEEKVDTEQLRLF